MRKISENAKKKCTDVRVLVWYQYGDCIGRVQVEYQSGMVPVLVCYRYRYCSGMVLVWYWHWYSTDMVCYGSGMVTIC